MSNVAIVDSNVFITLLKSGVDPAQWLGEKYQDIYSCGVIRVEVLRGVRDIDVRDRLLEFFDLTNQIPTDFAVWAMASELAWILDCQGRVLPLPDIVIAACAQLAGVPILTADSHFRHIPNLSIIPFNLKGSSSI